MRIRQYLLPFALGVAAGVLLHKNWPKIREVAVPFARDAIKGGSGLAARAREAMQAQSEKFADLVAEIREEDAAKAAAAAPSAEASS